MRRFATALVASSLAMALGAGMARASDNSPKNKESAPAPGAGTTGATEVLTGGTAGESTADNYVRRDLAEYANKRWQLDAVWEAHAMLIPWNIDHEGAGAEKLLNIGYLSGRVNLTTNNRLSVRMGMYIFDLCDANESGCVRATDLSVTYTRIQNIGKGFGLRFSASATAPTSFSSWHDSGLITALTGVVAAGYQHRWLSLDLRAFGSGYIQRWASELGGNPNPKGSFGVVLSATVEMPFWRRLTLGAEIYDEYTWLYDIVNGAPNPTGSGAGGAVVKDPTFGTSQPAQQIYGGEVFAEVRIPDAKYVQFDLHVAYAQGDPTLGYTSVLHDGVAHLYGFWRLNSEVYAALTAHF